MTTTRRTATPRGPVALIALLGALAIAGSWAPVQAPVAGLDATPPAGAAAAAMGAAESPAPSTTMALTPAPSATPLPVPTASPLPTVPPTPEPPRVAFEMNLYRTGDFVRQYTFDWCVGASLQMALNMATEHSFTARAHQQALWEMAVARSTSPRGGANAVGWTATLNDLGIGPYELISVADYGQALQVAAAAIRATGRPVGLLMWRGRHAWVMSGFTSIGDPAVHDAVEVTGIRILDPLYPHGDDVWGPSPRPNALLTPAKLAEQFVLRDRGRVNLGLPPGYFLILPTDGTFAASFHGTLPDWSAPDWSAPG